MAPEGKKKGIPALGWWLMLVGSLRLASVWFGFFDIWALRVAVFSQAEMTNVHGRTFGVWTLLTCTLCFLCALNLENRPLYLATFLSFIYALGHFLTEYLVYHTMAAANLSTVGFFAGLQFNLSQDFINTLFLHFKQCSVAFIVSSSNLAKWHWEFVVLVACVT
ncbi:Ergosterol biosynthetic protein 28 [Dichanthelium oligosanthes]|uniref:Ergosterol biosynthetic protein 28 n=1 Tax=Dichanthelium oligosanthes TaxID=888268 RepID=A0A1E5UST6_9POAL|nr:Ergosterol biosynthetic protein 28 [Dichanthelium oligosanthes]